MSSECTVDGGLLEAGNKLAVREMAGIAVVSLDMLRPTDNAQCAALLSITEGLKAVGEGTNPSKAFKDISADIAADALKFINTIAHGDDDALDWLREGLEAITKGSQVVDALGWRGKPHRPSGNFRLRNWLIQTEVYEVMRSQTRPSWNLACAAVAERVPLSVESIEQIASGVSAAAIPEMPEDMFPAGGLDPLRRVGVLIRVN